MAGFRTNLQPEPKEMNDADHVTYRTKGADTTTARSASVVKL